MKKINLPSACVKTAYSRSRKTTVRLLPGRRKLHILDSVKYNDGHQQMEIWQQCGEVVAAHFKQPSQNLSGTTGENQAPQSALSMQ
jgi:hypothetical protein